MKTREEIKLELASVESDPDLKSALVTVQEDAQKALWQLSLKTRAAALRWVLGLPLLYYHGRDEELGGEGIDV